MRPPVEQIVFSLHLKILTTESLLSRNYYRLSSAISLMSPISPSFALDVPGVQSVAVKSCVPCFFQALPAQYPNVPPDRCYLDAFVLFIPHNAFIPN